MNVNWKIIKNENDTVTVSGYCRVTGKPYSVMVPFAGFERWHKGELIQNALPDVTVADREFLISGCSPEGWNQLFGQMED